MAEMERKMDKKILVEISQWEETVKLLRETYEKEIFS